MMTTYLNYETGSLQLSERDGQIPIEVFQNPYEHAPLPGCWQGSFFAEQSYLPVGREKIQCPAQVVCRVPPHSDRTAPDTISDLYCGTVEVSQICLYTYVQKSPLPLYNNGNLCV